MKKHIHTTCAILLVAILTGCSAVDSRPVCATGAPLGTKEGRASRRKILGMWTVGDNTIATAARNGNITKISTVDDTGSETGLYYSERTTIVTGE